MTTAFLGLGRMGVLMAGHLLDAGHDLVVWNRSPAKASPLASRGSRLAPSVADAVAGADRVVLMLFGPDSVREVLARGRHRRARRRRLSQPTKMQNGWPEGSA